MATGQRISMLPEDADVAVLVGRIWSDAVAGPVIVKVRGRDLVDLSSVSPTVAELLNDHDVQAITEADGPIVAHIDDCIAGKVRLLAPVDLQCIKACGVTFATSALERVIEERAKGDTAAAKDIRVIFERAIGSSLRGVRPGSPGAERLKALLIEQGYWSQYLEVAIGPDAEVFTKAPCLSAVGWGDEVGVRADSVWNNPEPEIVLVCDGGGHIVGATLGNDVNLRDFEGRSALLLGKAKDNNASCAIGPFIRLFDDHFGIDDIRGSDVQLTIEGIDGFCLDEFVSMREIARDPTELVSQTCDDNHSYPDGFALFLGTLFAPVKDRGRQGEGFTHKLGDIVTIAAPKLGYLQNRVNHSHLAPTWTFGIGALMRNLSARGLLAR